MTDIIFPTETEWQDVYELITTNGYSADQWPFIMKALAQEMIEGHSWSDLYTWLLDVAAGADFIGGWWLPDEYLRGESYLGKVLDD